MNPIFYKNIANSSAHKISRETNANLVLETPELLGDLVHVALDISDKNHYKACWILELVLAKKVEWFEPFLHKFSNQLLHFSHDSAIRPMSKICMLCAKHHLEDNKFLSQKQLQKMAEACFHWLITDQKVAVKAYSIYALYELGKLDSWIYPELKAIISKDFSVHSAAYKSVTKKLLPKLH